MRKRKLVTHSGTAHRDEFLACCAILYHEHSTRGQLVTIERRVVADFDMENDLTWVIDTGGKWQPELLNFDHHQEGSDVADKCALDLVLEHLLGKAALKRYRHINPWMVLTSLHDTRGPNEAARSLGVDARTYSLMRSPVERLILGRFSESQIIFPESSLHAEMREMGRVMMNQSLDLESQYAALNRIPGPGDFNGIRVWDVRPAFKEGEFDSFAVVNTLATTHSVDVVISHNFRRNAPAVFRSEWAAGRLDFSRLEGQAYLIEAHANGFYAVFQPGTKDPVIHDAIQLAIVPQKGT